MTKARVTALMTPQWWDGWDTIDWEASGHDAPVNGFLTFVMKASELRQLSGVYRRAPKATEGRLPSDNIQRPHEETRSKEIRRFVEVGYPQSGMTVAQLRKSPDSDKRPGWLPTAVVVNILAPGESRDGLRPLDADHAVEVPTREWSGGEPLTLLVPRNEAHPDGVPELGPVPMDSTPPFEVIDGQHRLWAFEEDLDTEDYYLPVIAFVNLSKSYQAYLFWSINIKPKKINTSLAFDLYPVLRSQDWLMKGEGLKVYRESRAQELTEALWAVPMSPWYERINMIGATGVSDEMPVTQASFVRALMASFVRSWQPQGGRSLSGGLFSSDDAGGLDWNRTQQAAYLVASWRQLEIASDEETPDWLTSLRSVEPGAELLSKHSVLGTDQGIRAYSLVVNELSYALRDEYSLRAWRAQPSGESINPAEVREALSALEDTNILSLLNEIAREVIKFDWRSSRYVLDEGERDRLELFRGSSGYIRLRARLYDLLKESPNPVLAEASSSLLAKIRKEVEAL